MLKNFLNKRSYNTYVTNEFHNFQVKGKYCNELTKADDLRSFHHYIIKFVVNSTLGKCKSNRIF